ncbi:uncharacterized protein LOC110368831 isoform X2 [Fundulus heteroclitus]|uniref:uncharacterized protein LOC110368831 isoform X2 n=1 Tax=Fundulus heteroclitus TaxID=8078 RepID=UPI00165A26C5|nr:uncharacterized protein LOC110368831 isoform X2 [Fundulus heteroclitus]
MGLHLPRFFCTQFQTERARKGGAAFIQHRLSDSDVKRHEPRRSKQGGRFKENRETAAGCRRFYSLADGLRETTELLQWDLMHAAEVHKLPINRKAERTDALLVKSHRGGAGRRTNRRTAAGTRRRAWCLTVGSLGLLFMPAVNLCITSWEKMEQGAREREATGKSFTSTRKWSEMEWC